MKAIRHWPAVLLLLACNTIFAQVQWYQQQDGQNDPPYGTVATSVHPFNSGSFIACYLWSSSGDQNTWKISRTHLNGTELKTHYITGGSSTLECLVSRNNTVFALERSFTADYAPQYRLYKLDANLNRTAEKEIGFPGGFVIYSLNGFTADDDGNIFVAGDGQFSRPDGNSVPASFVLKLNRQLQPQWQRMDSTETSFTALHTDRWGRVLVVEDHPSLFPLVRIRRFTHNGQSLPSFSVHTDPGRFSLFTTLDEDDNLLLYGCKSAANGLQAIYLKRVSRVSGQSVYSRTHFTAPSAQVIDLRSDRNGNIFTLTGFYTDDSNSGYRISRISLYTGHLSWSRVLSWNTDSCILSKLVLGHENYFYAIGEKRKHNYYGGGLALRYKKNGQPDGRIQAPDSTAFQRSHWLTDGFIDTNNKLVAVGSTSDVDTVSFSNQYFRSFAVRFEPGRNDQHAHCDKALESGRESLSAGATSDEATRDEEGVKEGNQLVVYPNPVQTELTVTRIDPQEFDRLAVFNMQGMQVLQQKISGTTVRLQTLHWPSGVYLLQLRSGNSLKEKTIKFVVRE